MPATDYSSTTTIEKAERLTHTTARLRGLLKSIEACTAEHELLAAEVSTTRSEDTDTLRMKAVVLIGLLNELPPDEFDVTYSIAKSVAVDVLRLLKSADDEPLIDAEGE